MNDNWKPIKPEFTITPDIERAINNSQTNNLREQLGIRADYEMLKHNKMDDLIEKTKDQNYLLSEQLDELANTNRQLKEEKLMLEGRLEAFREQNEELQNKNQQLTSQLKEAVEKAGKPQWKFTIVTGVIVGVSVLFIGWLCSQLNITLSDILNLLQRK